MARKLAAEKAKSAALAKRLKRSKKKNQDLVATRNRQLATDGWSTAGAGSFQVEDESDSASTINATEADGVQAISKNAEENQLAAEEGSSSTGGTLHLEGGNEFSSTRNGTDADRMRMNWRNMTDNSREGSRFLSSMNQLSVASINVPECKPADDGDIHRQTYELWKDLLIDSMNLAGIDDEHTMFTVFKVKAGIKLLEIFRNTKSQQDDPDVITRPFSNAMQRLKSYFGSGSDIMLMRRKLALMSQKVDETDLAYITRVGSMARLCGYDEGKEFEEIVATVAEHARHKEVRMTALKMLSKRGSFTDLVDKVREIESIRLNEEYVLRKRGRTDQASVAAVSIPFHRQSGFQDRYAPVQTQAATRNVSNRRQQRFMDRYQTRPHPYQRGMQKPREGWRAPRGVPYRSGEAMPKCWRCESFSHSADDCGAKDKVCNFCGKLGHIRRACQVRSMKTESQRSVKSRDESPKGVAAVEKFEDVPVDDEKVERSNLNEGRTTPAIHVEIKLDETSRPVSTSENETREKTYHTPDYEQTGLILHTGAKLVRRIRSTPSDYDEGYINAKVAAMKVKLNQQSGKAKPFYQGRRHINQNRNPQTTFQKRPLPGIFVNDQQSDVQRDSMMAMMVLRVTPLTPHQVKAQMKEIQCQTLRPSDTVIRKI
nr:uncharacterized protein LOC115266783 [Aedes albopictus]